MKGRAIRTAKVVELSIDETLRPLEIEDGYEAVMLVVRSTGSVVGQLLLPARAVVSVETQLRALEQQLGTRLVRRELAGRFLRNCRSENDPPPAAQPTVSVVVCTRDRAEQLRVCLDGLVVLRTPVNEILVVDSSPADDASRRLCEGYPVRYVREDLPGQARARNRGVAETSGELVAFTDDDCVPDPAWLDGLSRDFDDPLVAAVTGYMAPLELETPSQCLFELHGGFEKHFERRIFDGTRTSPAVAAGPAGAGGNSIFRRSALAEISLFAEDLGPGTPALAADDRYAYYRLLEAGYRIVFDPARLVWHRHRSDPRSVRRILFAYTASSTAYASRCLFRHREPAALRIWGWWWLRHLRRDLAHIVRREPGALPIGVAAAELAGTVAGPLALARSRWSRRHISPICVPPQPQPVASYRPLTLSEEPPQLSVTIASHNRRDLLRAVLAALAGQSYPSDRFEVVLVLDGATDGSSAMATRLDVPYELRVLEQPCSGAARARNRAVREARNPIVVWLDDDVVPERDFLAQHASAHRHGSGARIVLGYYPPVLASEGFWALYVRAWWEDHFRRKRAPDHQWTYVDFVSGNASMPRALSEETGGFDESFRGRREDWEYGVRLLEQGVRFTYDPGAVGRHHVDTSFDTALRNARKEAVGDVLLARRHPRVKGHLPLVSSPFARREPREAYLRLARPWLDAYEAMRLRRKWRRLAGRLLREAYALGLAETMPREEFRELVSDASRHSATLRVDLDGGEPLRIPPGGGQVELEVSYAGAPLGRVEVLPVQGQWDWADVTDRVVWELADGAPPALLEDRLAELRPGSPLEAVTELRPL